LAIGLTEAIRARGGLWFGWSGENVSGEPAETDVVRRAGVTYATTDMEQSLFKRYYSGFANSMLWPLFHYFVETFQYDDTYYEAYLEANRFFAGRLEALLEPGDLVWIHDYHLIPLGRFLRDLGIDQPAGFFLHIPFPHYEVLRALPVYAELLRDLCSYNVIGFQTANDLRCFREAVGQVWGADAVVDPDSVTTDGHTARTGVFPIGVNTASIREESANSVATEAVRRMVNSVGGRKLVIGVDRLDYSKGMVERFTAFNRFLEDHPESHRKVVMMQIAPLSRADMRAYASIREQLESLAGRINGRFADTDWTPLRYLNRNFAHETLMGFMRFAQAALVTPVRDGMNLVAKEFVAAQDPQDPGVLILSTLAGAASELKEALLVNPYDTSGVAQAIQAALAMPLSERRQRHEGLLHAVERNDIHAWHISFLEALESRDAGSAVEASFYPAPA
jgi:trehalose 6-phosphate synthase